jgi:hypothetical protein
MANSYRLCGLLVFQLIWLISSGASAIERWLNSNTRKQPESTDEIWDEWLWHEELWQQEISEELSTPR